MSMREYPLTAPVAFNIDPEVAAYLKLKWDQENDCVPDAVQKLLDAGKFAEAARNNDPVLLDEMYLDVMEAAEILSAHDIKFVYAGSFDGNTTHLDHGLKKIDEYETYDDDYIAFIEPQCESNFFKASYENIDEILQEFKDKLEPVGAFPPDFDWSRKLVKVCGTYFA